MGTLRRGLFLILIDIMSANSYVRQFKQGGFIDKGN